MVKKEVCDQCEDTFAEYRCKKCKKVLCGDCFTFIHKCIDELEEEL